MVPAMDDVGIVPSQQPSAVNLCIPTTKRAQKTYLLLYWRGVLMRNRKVTHTPKLATNPIKRQMWNPDTSRQNAYTSMWVRPRTIFLRYKVIMNADD